MLLSATVDRMWLRAVDMFKRPPALTAGLTVFLVAFYDINYMYPEVFDAILLHASAPWQLQLNRLLLYPLGHTLLFHLLVNLVGLVPMVGRYERLHGTVYTGVTLNVLAVVAALLYSVVGTFACPETDVLGLSAWWFSFVTFYAIKDSAESPHTNFMHWSIPTLWLPAVPLVMVTIMFPYMGLLVGHCAGIGAGYLLAHGYLAFMFPPLWIIEKIEAVLSRLIALIPRPIVYTKEEEARGLRAPEVALPVTEVSAPTPRFAGGGHVLGA